MSKCLHAGAFLSCVCCSARASLPMHLTTWHLTSTHVLSNSGSSRSLDRVLTHGVQHGTSQRVSIATPSPALDHCQPAHAQDEAAAAQKRREDAASARVAALRSSDMSSYMTLLQQTKNRRLQEVLAQTDSCLAQIAAKLGDVTSQGKAAPAGGLLLVAMRLCSCMDFCPGLCASKPFGCTAVLMQARIAFVLVGFIVGKGRKTEVKVLPGNIIVSHADRHFAQVLWSSNTCVGDAMGLAGDGAGSSKGALSTWDALASSLPADIPEQPQMLQGGSLREYQMQVRQGAGLVGAARVRIGTQAKAVSVLGRVLVEDSDAAPHAHGQLMQMLVIRVAASVMVV